MALLGVLALALLLRLWGVTFGFPFIYHYDEPSQVNVALRLGRGEFGGIRTTTGFANILFAEYAAWLGLGRLAGEFSSAAEAALAWQTHPTYVHILLGRLTSAFLGTLTVAVVYRLGRCISGRAAGLLAASFLAVAFLHTRSSHYARPDIAVAFLVCSTVLLTILAVQRRERWYLCGAGAAAGLAIAVKWTAAPVLLPLVLATGYTCVRDRAHSPRTSGLVLTLLASGGSFAVGFLLGGFELLMDPSYYLNYRVLQLRHATQGGFWIWQVDTVSGWAFYLKTLNYGLGAVLLILALVGLLRRLVLVVRTRDNGTILMLSFVLPYYVLMGTTRHYFARYVLPLIPFLAVFAADSVLAIAAWLGARGVRGRRVIIGALVAVAIAQPLAWSIRHDVLLTRTDTRTLAKEWIEAHIPAGAKFALDWPVYSPPLSRELYSVKELGQLGLARHPLEWYRQEGFDYIVTSSFVYDLPLRDSAQASTRQAFYTALNDELELVGEFSPYSRDAALAFVFEEIYGPATTLWHRERPGPVLRLYRVQ